jgi:uncharacterized hydrophobic protein (TIGR00271 family)
MQLRKPIMQSTSDLRSLAHKVGFDPAYLEAFEDKLFIQGPKTARRLTNFFVLLLLATVIATFGVLSDSTATVIGAMIVAPLMGPIMATAASIVMGSAQRSLRALALVAAGVVATVLLSWLLAWGIPDVIISFTYNSQITSRIAPGLLALITALASGAAGAYITLREEIADSMGGVAIAISLVPPLCVVGIALSQGNWGAAGGAMLLFLTNFLAILLAGGIVFQLSGLGRLAISGDLVRTRRNAFIVVIVATLLVAVPLTITSYQVVDDALENKSATSVADEWLVDTNYQVVNVIVNDERVTVTIEGQGDLRPLRQLAGQLAQTLERPIWVNLRTVPSQIEASNTGAP